MIKYAVYLRSVSCTWVVGRRGDWTGPSHCNESNTRHLSPPNPSLPPPQSPRLTPEPSHNSHLVQIIFYFVKTKNSGDIFRNKQ